MHERELALLGRGRLQAIGQPLDGRQLARLRRAPLAAPALELAGRVRRVRREVFEPGRAQVDRMHARERVDERGGQARARGRAEAARRVVEDDPVDERHQQQRRVTDRLVVGEAEHGRRRDGGRAERAQDAMLARHVVGRRQPRADRRAPEDPAPAGGVRDEVGQVGLAVADAREAQRRLRAQVQAEDPRLHGRWFEARPPRSRLMPHAPLRPARSAAAGRRRSPASPR